MSRIAAVHIEDVPARDPHQDAGQIVKPLSRQLPLRRIEMRTVAVEDAVCGAAIFGIVHAQMMLRTALSG